jgi:hypothetical protein
MLLRSLFVAALSAAVVTLVGCAGSISSGSPGDLASLAHPDLNTALDKMARLSEPGLDPQILQASELLKSPTQERATPLVTRGEAFDFRTADLVTSTVPAYVMLPEPIALAQ